SRANILVLIESLGRGGAERALVNQLPELRRRGFDIEVAALWAPYDLAPELEQQGVPVHRLDVRPRWNALGGLRALARLGRRRRIDVVHGHLFFGSVYTALSRAV